VESRDWNKHSNSTSIRRLEIHQEPGEYFLVGGCHFEGTGFLCRDGGEFLGLIVCGRTEGSRFWPKELGLDLAYQEWICEPRTITGNVNPTVNGMYHAFVRLGACPTLPS
jgi:hypothetical protein